VSEILDWSIDKIQDDVYRTKFVELPRIINEWTEPYGGITGKTILDFGCGEATTAIGLALKYEPKRVVGVEIQSNIQECLPLAKEQIGIGRLPERLELKQISPGDSLDDGTKYDLIYSWSVFEHVEQSLIPRALESLRQVIKPNGILFIQIAPLYYSAEGSHMMPWVRVPWGHLIYQHDIFYHNLARVVGDGEELRSLWSTYRTLNKLTAPQLVDAVKAAGFEIVRDYRTKDEYDIPSSLRAIFQEDVLTTNQIVILARAAEIDK